MLTMIAGLVLSTTLGVQQTPKAPAPDPRERLDTAIAEGIKLLEAKDYAKFLTMFVPPDVLASRGQPIEQFAADFGSRRGPLALAALKQIQHVKPALSADGLTATFDVTQGPDGGPTSMTWGKIGKYWYIQK